MAAKIANNVWLKKIQAMLPGKGPGTPPIPKKELVKLLKKVRGLLNRAIVALEKEGKKTKAGGKTRRGR